MARVESALPALCFLALLFLVFLTAGSAARCPGNVCTAGLISVGVNGNSQVPKYTFWDNSKASNKYFVMFQQMFELSGGKKYGPSNIALPSLNWDWSSFEWNQSTSTYTFNITATPKNKNHANFDSLLIRNHLTASNQSLSKATLKFDILLENYSWQSSDANAELVFNVKLLDSNNSDSDQKLQSSTSVVLDGAFFQITTSALASNDNWKSSSSVKASLLVNGTGGSDNGIWIVYSHFTGSLEHDPTFGISQSSTGHIILIVVIVLVVLAVVIVGIVAGVLYYRRRRSYHNL
jgi:hypothetical protein